MPGREQRVFAVAIGCLGLLMVLAAALSGRVTLISRSDPDPAPPGEISAAAPTAGTPTSAHPGPNPLLYLGIFFLVVLASMVALAVYGLLTGRRRRRPRGRRQRVPRGPASSVRPSDEIRAEQIATLDDAFARGLEALNLADIRQALIWCWLRVEDAALMVGVPISPTDTSTELVTRVLRTYGITPQPLEHLAAHYRVARFSDHPLTEAMREDARVCLSLLREELGVDRVRR